MEKIIYLGNKNKAPNLLFEQFSEDFEVIFSVLTEDMCQETLQIPRGEVWVLDSSSYEIKEIEPVLTKVIQSVRTSLIPLMIIIESPVPDEVTKYPEAIWRNPLIEIVSPLFPLYIIKNSLRKLVLLANQLVKTAEFETENRYLRDQTKEAENRMEKLVLENDTLLQEVHHRVKNNLQIVSSILSLKTDEANSPEIKDILQTTQSRIDAISLIHKKLYESSDFSEIDMKSYFQQQLTDLFYTYPIRSGNIDLDLRIAPFSLMVTRAIHCAQLVNELVVNVFFHAFPEQSAGILKIQFKKVDGEMIFLTIEDNGVGLKDDIEVLRNQSIGLRLVFQLAKQLNATIEVIVNQGTRFTVCFPL